MVSNTLGMELPELLERVDRLRREFGESREYQAWRRQLPEDWPL